MTYIDKSVERLEIQRHAEWYKKDDPIAYKHYRGGSPEFEADFGQSEKSWLAAKLEAVPDGFILIPEKLTIDEAIKYAESEFKKNEYLIDRKRMSSFGIDFEGFKARWIRSRASAIYAAWDSTIRTLGKKS